MHPKWKNGCAGTGETLPGSAHGISMKLISKLMADGLTCTVLYRAVDNRGRTVDFYLSPRRNSKAAYRFLGKILNNVKGWPIPRLINTDKAPTYGRALTLLKREGRCPPDVEH
jgi:hypothetical protein